MRKVARILIGSSRYLGERGGCAEGCIRGWLAMNDADLARRFEKENQELREKINDLNANYARDMKKLLELREISSNEVEHQRHLLNRYKKELEQTKEQLERLPGNTEQECGRKYRLELDDLRVRVEALKASKKSLSDENAVLETTLQNLKQDNQDLQLRLEKQCTSRELEEKALESRERCSESSPEFESILRKIDDYESRNVELEKKVKLATKDLEFVLDEKSCYQTQLQEAIGELTSLGDVLEQLEASSREPKVQEENEILKSILSAQSFSDTGLSEFDRKYIHLYRQEHQCNLDLTVTKQKIREQLQHKKNDETVTSVIKSRTASFQRFKAVAIEALNRINVIERKMLIKSMLEQLVGISSFRNLGHRHDQYSEFFSSSLEEAERSHETLINKLHKTRVDVIGDATTIHDLSLKLCDLTVSNVAVSLEISFLKMLASIDENSQEEKTFDNGTKDGRSDPRPFPPSTTTSSVIVDLKEMAPQKINECSQQ